MKDLEDMEKTLEDERREERRIEDLQYREECRKERTRDDAWDMNESDYL